MSQKKRVLIVEDETVNRKILKKLLSEEYEVLEARNGKEALDLIEGDPSVAAVMLDLIMPVMDGFEVLRRLQESGKTLSLPVIVMTGESDSDT